MLELTSTNSFIPVSPTEAQAVTSVRLLGAQNTAAKSRQGYPWSVLNDWITQNLPYGNLSLTSHAQLIYPLPNQVPWKTGVAQWLERQVWF